MVGLKLHSVGFGLLIGAIVLVIRVAVPVGLDGPGGQFIAGGYQGGKSGVVIDCLVVDDCHVICGCHEITPFFFGHE